MALVNIGNAAGILGVEVQTLRAWEKSGELVP
jgi:DNA-binding transcriptional MerR regulator